MTLIQLFLLDEKNRLTTRWNILPCNGRHMCLNVVHVCSRQMPVALMLWWICLYL